MLTGFALRRTVASLPVLAALGLLVFLAMEAGPGDAASALIDPEAGDAEIEALREEMGLHRPWPIRFVHWGYQWLGGNWGYSAVDGAPVRELLAQRLPRTLGLMMVALSLGGIGGILLGTFAALRRGSPWDHVLSTIGLTGLAVPPFFTAVLGIYIFAVGWGVLPVGGISPRPGLVPLLSHLVLPAGVLALRFGADAMRYTRIAVIDVLACDYVMLARSKGLSALRVAVRHVLRTALIPVVTFMVLRLPSLIAGSVIIEEIFSWPGVGSLFVSAVRARDQPVVMAVAMLVGCATLVASLLADCLLAVIDPRVRLS